MKIIKKMIAAVLLCCTALSITACGDTTWAFKYKDTDITSGLYIMRSMTAYTTAYSHKDKNPDIEDLFKQKLDGKAAKDWIVDETKRLCADYVAIEQKFAELELSFTESDLNMIEQQYKEGWPAVQAFFEKNGVGENTYRTSLENARKREKIFEKYYDKGGIEEIADNDLMAHFKENFASLNMFGIKLETGDDLTDEQKATNEEAKKSADKLIKMLNEDDKTYNEVYVEYLKMENEGKPEEEQKDTTLKEDEDTKIVIKKGSTTPSEKIVKAIFEEMKPDGDGVLLTDDNAYYIAKRYDITKDEKNFDEMRKQIIMDIKGEDFNKMVEEWTSKVSSDLVVNDASIKRYTPKNIDFTL